MPEKDLQHFAIVLNAKRVRVFAESSPLPALIVSFEEKAGRSGLPLIRNLLRVIESIEKLRG
jgi:hypothetical protein